MKYGSDLLRTAHELAVEMFAIGAISEAEMREFDELCLVPEGNPRTESTPIKCTTVEHISA